MEEINKYILQYLLQHGVIEANDAVSLIKKIAENIDVQPKDIKKIISEVNVGIYPQQFMIEIKTCEVTGKQYAVFLNLAADSFSTGQKHFSAIEVDMLTVIFQNIMLSNSKSITVIQALNFTSRIKGSITKDVAQEKINHWAQTGYLVEENGLLCLGPRAIGEFGDYFKGQYPNRITKCNLCIDTVYFGKICANCNEVLHNHCMSKHLNRSESCPLCKTPWKEAEEREYEDENEDENKDENEDEEMDD